MVAGHDQFVAVCVDGDGIVVVNAAVKQGTGDAILHLFLNDAPEGAGTELRIIALTGQQIAGGVRQLDLNMAFLQARTQMIDLNIDNLPDPFESELMENHNLIDSVDKLWPEALSA